jgi:hypothetical protein
MYICTNVGTKKPTPKTQKEDIGFFKQNPQTAEIKEEKRFQMKFRLKKY